MGGLIVSRGSYELSVPVPDDLVSVSEDGEAEASEWAAWVGFTRGGGRAPVLVSVTVTGFDSKRETLVGTLRERYPDAALVEEFSTTGGQLAVGLRRVVTQRVRGRDVTTGQAQVLVVYPGPGALGVISGVCPDPADLDQAAVLITSIAAGMTVTSATAAA